MSITVAYTGAREIVATDFLTQWSTGQTVTVTGLEFGGTLYARSEIAKVSREAMATRCTGASGGSVVCPIPDHIMSKAGTLIVNLADVGDSSATVRCTIKIPVRSAAMPGGWDPDPGNVIVIEQLANKVNAACDEANAAVSAANTAVTNANAAVVRANAAVEATQEAKQNAESAVASADEAVSSADAAVAKAATALSDAEAAKAKADEATSAAEAAKATADEAASEADEAKARADAAAASATSAAEGAEKVDASLSGTVLTVTGRTGASSSVDTKGDKGDKGEKGDQGDQGLPGAVVSCTSGEVGFFIDDSGHLICVKSDDVADSFSLGGDGHLYLTRTLAE